MTTDRETFLIDMIESLLKAMRDCQAIGCIDHTDCWDDAEELWHEPRRLAAAEVKKFRTK